MWWIAVVFSCGETGRGRRDGECNNKSFVFYFVLDSDFVCVLLFVRWLLLFMVAVVYVWINTRRLR